jgi:undecaprenyl-diphosphatase
VFWTELNLSVFHAINGLAARNLSLDRLIGHLEETGLKGIIIMGTFGVLWFGLGSDQARRREGLVAMILAMALSILLIRVIALVTPFQIRPMYATDIGFRTPLSGIGTSNFEAWSSFPSDVAGMMFSFATGFWFASKLWGSLFGVFSVFALLARVYFGIHYPGDVVVGALIGISVTVALNAEPMRTFIAAPALHLERRAPAVFYGFLLVILYESGTLFITVRNIGRAVLHLLTGNHS